MVATTIEHVTWIRNKDGSFHVEGWRGAGTSTCICGYPITILETVYQESVPELWDIEWSEPRGVCANCGHEVKEAA